MDIPECFFELSSHFTGGKHHFKVTNDERLENKTRLNSAMRRLVYVKNQFVRGCNILLITLS